MAKRRKGTLLELSRETREREKLIFQTLKISSPEVSRKVRWTTVGDDHSICQVFYLLYTSDNCTMDTNFSTYRRAQQSVYFNASAAQWRKMLENRTLAQEIKFIRILSFGIFFVFYYFVFYYNLSKNIFESLILIEIPIINYENINKVHIWSN